MNRPEKLMRIRVPDSELAQKVIIFRIVILSEILMFSEKLFVNLNS